MQEVYFALTDGTAYLRAIMENDGNIRYANYQSQQQVINYLTANGWGPGTWAGWFPNSSGELEGFSEDTAAGAKDSDPGRALPAGLGGENAATPGLVFADSFAFAARPFEDHLRAEFY